LSRLIHLTLHSDNAPLHHVNVVPERLAEDRFSLIVHPPSAPDRHDVTSFILAICENNWHKQHPARPRLTWRDVCASWRRRLETCTQKHQEYFDWGHLCGILYTDEAFRLWWNTCCGIILQFFGPDDRVPLMMNILDGYAPGIGMHCSEWMTSKRWWNR
jgi:hypothetical protein